MVAHWESFETKLNTDVPDFVIPHVFTVQLSLMPDSGSPHPRPNWIRLPPAVRYLFWRGERYRGRAWHEGS